MSVLKLILLVLFCFSFQEFSYSKSNNIDVCSVWSDDWRNSVELKSHIYTSVKPAAGPDAGKYARIKVKNWEECVLQCCQFERCNVAYWISSTCLHIECISDEICQPVTGDNSDINDDTLFVQVRSVFLKKDSTAAALDYDDPGHDECNQTKLCPTNEQCEQVSINAQLKRNVCLCDRNNGHRRINGVCRQYLPNTKPCALYESDYDTNDADLGDRSQEKCRKNEECLPPNDRAKHGYCQCKLGYTRANANAKCFLDKHETSPTTTTIKSTTIPSLSDIEIDAGNDQIIVLPKNEVDLYAHVHYKSNKSEIDLSELSNKKYTLFWSLKSSSNGAKIDISNQQDLTSHILVKELREGTYEFELKLNDKQGTTLASDIVKVLVQSATTTSTTPPLILRISSSMTVYLPRKTAKIEAEVEPSDREVKYQWTYANDGPVTPVLENADTSDLLVSNLRPGKYSFQLRVTDNLHNEQTETIQLIAIGEPIEARVKNPREVVFWPPTDVFLDGTPSIIEQKTNILWQCISTDNKQKPDQVDILSPQTLKTQISGLLIGKYKFLLTLKTNDDKYVSTKEVLLVVYGENGQPPKVHIHLETQNVNLLNNLIILNGTNTQADYGVSKWQWSKTPSSPAIGYFINNSHLSPVAYLTNLIEGQYGFILQVTDDREQMSEMNITVNVNGIPDDKDLVEIIFQSKPYLYQQRLDTLLAQIRVFLIDILPNVEISMAGILKENILLIKGIDSKTELVISPKIIANHLQNKINSVRAASNINIVSINTYLCLSSCSNHGKCDQITKRCVCNKYYMENWFKSMIYKQPNCDFLIHYFVLITIGSSIFTLLFCWLCCCCCLRWRRRRKLLDRRRRIRYQLLQEHDDDNNDDYHIQTANSPREKSKNRLHFLKKNKTKTSNVIISASDSDASDEQTLYDKPLLASKFESDSPIVKTRGLKTPVQDSNGSPMLRLSGQSPTTTDNSVA